MFYDAFTEHNPFTFTLPELLAPPAPAAAPRKRRGARAKRRTPNWRGAVRSGTLAKQEAVLVFLELAGEGASVAQIGDALGISRQLALYHVKKMAATGLLVMQLEPCPDNGGLQFRCWKEAHLANRYARELRRAA